MNPFWLSESWPIVSTENTSPRFVLRWFIVIDKTRSGFRDMRILMPHSLECDPGCGPGCQNFQLWVTWSVRGDFLHRRLRCGCFPPRGVIAVIHWVIHPALVTLYANAVLFVLVLYFILVLSISTRLRKFKRFWQIPQSTCSWHCLNQLPGWEEFWYEDSPLHSGGRRR